MSFPEKWDLADPLPDGVSVEALRELIAAAHPYVGHQPPPEPVPLHFVPDAQTDTASNPGPLAALTALPNRVDVEDPAAFSEMLSGALEDFAAGLADRSDLERMALRQAAVEILKRRGVTAPASTVDSALKSAPRACRQRSASTGDSFDPASPYGNEDGCIVLKKYDYDGNVFSKPLCNFTAAVTEEVDIDDGSGESERRITVTGTLASGQAFSPATVTASQFNLFNWVLEKWGTSAVVYAGMATKDHLRAAVQTLSKKVARRVVKAFTGWTPYLGEWRYLHRGGSIGSDGAHDDLEVQLPAQLAGFALPDPPTGEQLVEAVRASLRLAEIGVDRVLLPLLAAVYRAVLVEAVPVDFSLFLVGVSGVFKSCLAALAQAHWGKTFTAKTLPVGWHSTANSIEKVSFQAKDVLITVDDFAPSGNRSDVHRLHQDAERLLRGAGNRLGRSRMNRSGGLAQVYHPRGLVVSTGEDVPKGLSLRARILILEVGQGDVDIARLTEAQKDAAAGLYAAAMAGYVQYLAGRLDELKTTGPNRLLELRQEASSGSVSHRRTPDIVASLQWGMETFLTFARDEGAITDDELEALRKRTWAALGEVAASQGAQLVDADPVDRFIALLETLFVSGRAHVVDAGTGGVPSGNPTRWGWQRRTDRGSFAGDPEHAPLGRGIGWVEGSEGGRAMLYLDPDAVYAEIQKVASDQNDSVSLTAKTLWKRLIERGVLQPGDGSRSTVKKRGLGGDTSIRPRVLVMPWPPRSGAIGATGATASPDAVFPGPDQAPDSYDEGPATGAGHSRPVPESEGGPAPRPLEARVGPEVADSGGPARSTLPLDISESGPAGPAPCAEVQLLEACDAAYRAVETHKTECPSCAAGRPCDEARRNNREYHTCWAEMQAARVDDEDRVQEPRPDREPGDDDGEFEQSHADTHAGVGRP
ncbi:MAG: hypothetical protein ACHQQS_00115 [Thermoanaerobaculales bacterium]